MSYTIDWHSHSLAGPEYNSSPDSTGSGLSSHIPRAYRESHILQKGRNNDIACFDQSLIGPPLRIGFDEVSAGVTDVVAYYDPCAYDTSTSCFNMDMFGSSYARSHVSDPLNAVDDKDPLKFLMALPQSPTIFPPLHDSPESPPVVTPKLEESEGLFLGSLSSSLSLSPYAPLPLPPIFTHESGSNVMPIPIDTTPPSPIWLRARTPEAKHSEEMRQFISNASLNSSVEVPTPNTRSPFLRGSTSIESIWPPASLPSVPFVPTLAQMRQLIFQEVAGQLRDIPLEVAESQAAELRASGTNVSLPSPFLMQFLGQPEGQTKWHCYIRGCGKQLTRKGHMMDHVRMHLDERSFACEYCLQTFLRKADCKRHAATHNPTKGFTCGSCPKSYARKDLLTRHTRICRLKSEEDSDQPDNKKRQKKRRVIRKKAIVNSQNTFNTPSPSFTTPDMFLHGCHEGNGGSQVLEYDDNNKENIDPLVFLSSSMF